MPSTRTVACRIFIIIAREAPIGIIFRRGPSKWTQIIKWDTDLDTFEYGAWFHGTIYPERCDISPDGTKLIYFAANYKNKESEFPSTWTAISKIPWLTALCVWPNSGTYFGGGLFETNRKIWVNQNIWRQGDLADGFVAPPDMEISFEQQFWNHDWHNLFRLERDGWKPKEAYPWGSIPQFRIQSDGTVVAEPTDPNCLLYTPSNIRTVHEKSSSDGLNTLIMTSNFLGENSRNFELRDNTRHTVTPIEGAIWADWDKKDRLVYARDGKVYTGTRAFSGKIDSQELAEFNSSKPKRTKSPDWARHW